MFLSLQDTPNVYRAYGTYILFQYLIKGEEFNPDIMYRIFNAIQQYSAPVALDYAIPRDNGLVDVWLSFDT